MRIQPKKLALLTFKFKIKTKVSQNCTSKFALNENNEIVFFN